MTDPAFDDLVAGWYRSRAETEPVPDRLRARVLALPEQRDVGAPWRNGLEWHPRPALLVAAILAALLLALAMTAAGMVPRLFAERTLAFPANPDACAVLETAVNPRQQPGWREGEHGLTTWGAHVCSYDRWDSGYDFKHLFLATKPTTLAEATALISDQSNWAIPEEGRGQFADPLPAVWRPMTSGVWAGVAAADAPRSIGMNALAVSREPYFFIVTGRWESQVLEDAQLVAGVLGVTLGDVPLTDWFVLPVPTMWRP